MSSSEEELDLVEVDLLRVSAQLASEEEDLYSLPILNGGSPMDDLNLCKRQPPLPVGSPPCLLMTPSM